MPAAPRQAPATRPANRRAARWTRLVVALLSLLILLSSVVLGWLWMQGSKPLVAPGPQARAVDLVIPYGLSAQSVARLVESRGFDLNAHVFILHARWEGVHRNLRAGVYRVEPGLTLRRLLHRLAGQDTTQTELRVLEGWTVAQAIAAMARNPDLRFDVLEPGNERELARNIGVSADHPEGWLYPDLYVIPKGSTVSELLSRSVQLQQERLRAAWEERSPKLGLSSAYEALILASIVEKETQHPGDRERVAAVFLNRLRLGMPLQADPTVIYGLGSRFDGDLTRRDLRADTPYNSYTRRGLPPTPISNPGSRAIRAVMHPADSPALYFVARGDGSSEFSDTLEAHNQAVDRYIRRPANRP